MKINKKIIIPAVAILAFSAIGVGATYALFTSGDKTDVAVQAGKVKVAMALESLHTFSGVDLKGDGSDPEPVATVVDGTFTNGGSAAIAGKVVTLSHMTPGDKVTFDVKITNLSNVSIKYQTTYKIKSDSGLFDGLVVTIDGAAFSGITDKKAWATMAGSDSEQVIKTVPVTIELPATAGSEYDSKSCELEFLVEAVQGNAYTSDPEAGVININSKEDLISWGKGKNKGLFAGQTAKLFSDIDFGGDDWTSLIGYGDFTLDGNEHTISNIDMVPNGTSMAAGLVGYWPGAVIKNLTIEDGTATGNNHVGMFVGSGTCVEVYDCEAVNCTVKSAVHMVGSSYDDGDKVGAIAGYLCYDGSDAKVVECVAENCTVEGYRDVGGIVGFTNGAATVTDCQVTGGTIINNRINGYKTYTTDAEYDVNEIIGEKSATTVESNNSFTNVTKKIVLADGFGINQDGEYEISNVNGMITFGSYVDNGTNLFEGKTVKLMVDLDMDEVEWNPIGEIGYASFGQNVFSGTFDGQNHKIENLIVFDKDSSGLFASLGGVVKDLTIKNSEITSNHYAGAVVGWVDCSGSVVIQNVKVWNTNITTSAHLKDGSTTEWDDGDKAGAIAGYVASSGNVINCTALGVHVRGYRDIGGIVGYLSSGVVSNNTIDGSFIINDRTHNYKGYTTDAEYDVHEVVGQNDAGTVENNTVTQVQISVVGA